MTCLNRALGRLFGSSVEAGLGEKMAGGGGGRWEKMQEDLSRFYYKCPDESC